MKIETSKGGEADVKDRIALITEIVKLVTSILALAAVIGAKGKAPGSPKHLGKRKR